MASRGALHTAYNQSQARKSLTADLVQQSQQRITVQFTTFVCFIDDHHALSRQKRDLRLSLLATRCQLSRIIGFASAVSLDHPKNKRTA